MVLGQVLPAAQSAKYVGSFAYNTVKDRLPLILTKTIDSMHRQNAEIKTQHGSEGLEQLNEVIGRLSELRYEIMTNKPLKQLPISNEPDSTIWTSWFESKLKENSNSFTWFDAPWLEIECYMYRVIYEAFHSHVLVRDIDAFGEAKLENLNASADSVDALFDWYEKVMLDEGYHSAGSEDFDLLVQLSLWGNRCDLSLSGGEQSAAQTLQMTPAEEVQSLKPWLLVDHSKSVWKWLCADSAKPKRIDVVLDNSGYELINNLLLVDWLLHQTNAHGYPLFSPIVFHCKSYPWFVSDTTSKDFEFTLDWLSKRKHSANMVARLRDMLTLGRFQIQSHHFWTTPFHFWLLKEKSPDLYNDLLESNLILFKGDLNGRKMFADLKWEPCTPFSVPVGPLTELFRCNSENGTTALCLARTLKCEVGFGITSEKAEELKSKHPDWSYSGKFGEIQAVVPKLN